MKRLKKIKGIALVLTCGLLLINSACERTSGPNAKTPNAMFSYSTGASFTVTFTNLSEDASSYLWDFGDGVTSTAVNPSHTYVSRGSKTVTLTARNGHAKDQAVAYIDMTSQIKLINQSSYPFNVSIDGVSQGTISGGTYKFYDVNPGTHKVYVEQKSGYTLWPTTRNYTLTCYAGYYISQSFDTVLD